MAEQARVCACEGEATAGACRDVVYSAYTLAFVTTYQLHIRDRCFESVHEKLFIINIDSLNCK